MSLFRCVGKKTAREKATITRITWNGSNYWISFQVDMTGKNKLIINKPDDSYTKFTKIILDDNAGSVNIYPSSLPYTVNWSAAHGYLPNIRFVVSNLSTVYDFNTYPNPIIETE